MNEIWNIQLKNHKFPQVIRAYNYLNHMKLRSEQDTKLFLKYFDHQRFPEKNPRLTTGETFELFYLVSFAQELAKQNARNIA